MSAATSEILAAHLGDLAALRWEAFEIPGGSSPVAVCRLHADAASRATTLVVRFPPGWVRDEPGSYAGSEEAFVIEGAVELNGQRHPAGSWFRVPGGAVRHHTATPEGAVALARFDGSLRWTPTRSAP